MASSCLNRTTSQVKDGEGRDHVVDFEAKECTCDVWQVYLLLLMLLLGQDI
jgi:hypothetical protein